MDNLSIQSFPDNVPFKEPLVITHFTSIVITFLLCYPLLFTQQPRRRKLWITITLLASALIGFISGCFVQPIHRSTTSRIFQLLALFLLCLLYLQVALVAYRSKIFYAKLDPLFHKIPDWFDLLLGCVIFIVVLSYLAIAAVVFTNSCTEDMLQSQCLAPLSMGIGFLIYGTFVLLHLLTIIKLPRLSTPEYYEGVILAFWGLISLLFSGTPILGSAWRAINLGLLWLTGGLFSIFLSVQTWLPALREKNIVNSIILFLSGRAIVRGITYTDDAYTSEVHTMLGYILMVGAMARVTQVIFRKSPVDNLPHRIFQHTNNAIIDQVDEEIDLLLKGSIKCKHHFIFASITLVSGLLASFLAISGGILFIGANTRWIRYMRYYINDPSTYVNVIFSFAFLWCAYVFALCTLYKTQITMYPYEYVELHHPTIAPLEQQTRYSKEGKDWTFHETPMEASLLPVTSPVYDNNVIRSPTFAEPDMLYRDQEYHHKSAPLLENAEKTIRPSEYRAKRRSLLMQSANSNTSMTINTKRHSSLGVGGILPDDPPESPFRKSWLSSGSSIGYYSGSSSSAPNSPLLPPSTQPHSHVYFTNSSQRGRSHSEASFYQYDEEDTLRKTKSGRRKERLQMMQDHKEDHQSRTGFQQRWSQQ